MERENYSRAEILDMVSRLSDEALRYVQRPIVYAYRWTDQNGAEYLTKNDTDRIRLYIAITNGTDEDVHKASEFLTGLFHAKLREQRKQQKMMQID